MDKVTVLGGGSFGTALAQHLARQNHNVCLWVRSAETAAFINAHHRNPNYLKDFTLDPSLWATDALDDAVRHGDWLVSGLPSSALRPTLQQIAPWVSKMGPRPVVMGTKGLEHDTLLDMEEATRDVLGQDWGPYIVALSGPSFAREIIEAHPTAVVLACCDEALAKTVSRRFFCEHFRAYCSTDVVGVELGGALKNVMAIAAGAVSGLGMGDNTRAAMITRGLAEITRLTVAKGGQALTLLGLAGVGDLVLTCTGGLSRNRAVGQALGEGQSVAMALQHIGQVAEGVKTAGAAHRLAQRLEVDAPIIRAVYRVLYENLPAREAVLELVRREPGRELD